jgi:MFS family permease
MATPMVGRTSSFEMKRHACEAKAIAGAIRRVGILVLLSGLVIGAYAAVSAIAIWLAEQLRGPNGAEMATRMEADGMPSHHMELLSHYAEGYRLRAWQASVVMLGLALIALIFGYGSAAFWFGLALIIDCVLFMTCRNRKQLLAQLSPTEQVVDVAQTLALLAAFIVLAWRQLVNLA